MAYYDELPPHADPEDVFVFDPDEYPKGACCSACYDHLTEANAMRRLLTELDDEGDAAYELVCMTCFINERPSGS